MSRELSPIEIVGLLDFNPTIESLVHQHDAYVTSHGWDQVALVQDPSLNAQLPIPVWGKTLTDPTYGRVIIFPDAHGILHYVVAETPAEQAVADEIDKPIYYSQPGSVVEDLMNQIRGVISGIGSFGGGLSAGLIIAGFIGILILTQKARS